jgi:hypothetical protein
MRIVRDPIARLEKYRLGVHAEFPRYLSIAARRRPSIRRRCSPKSYAAFPLSSSATMFSKLNFGGHQRFPDMP